MAFASCQVARRLVHSIKQENSNASGRKAAVKSGVKAVGGRLESMYYCFGKDDVVVIMDLPDNVVAASLVTAVGASGLVRARTTPLLTVEEMDKALAKKVGYKGPGSAR